MLYLSHDTCQYVFLAAKVSGKTLLFLLTDWLSRFEFPYQSILLFLPTGFTEYFLEVKLVLF